MPCQAPTHAHGPYGSCSQAVAELAWEAFYSSDHRGEWISARAWV